LGSGCCICAASPSCIVWVPLISGQDSTPQRDPLWRNQHIDLLALVQLAEHLGLRLDLPVAAPVS